MSRVEINGGGEFASTVLIGLPLCRAWQEQVEANSPPPALSTSDFGKIAKVTTINTRGEVVLAVAIKAPYVIRGFLSF